MSRNIFHITHLNAFIAWLDEHGIQHRPGRGQFQVLQVSLNSRDWFCIYERHSSTEHYTVDHRIERMVRKFITANRKRKERGDA